MTGYIVLGVFIFFVFSCFFFFIFGFNKGRKKEVEMYDELKRQRNQAEKDFNKVTVEIKQEVFNEAENKKSRLSGGNTGRDRFNNINNSLQNNSSR